LRVVEVDVEANKTFSTWGGCYCAQYSAGVIRFGVSTSIANAKNGKNITNYNVQGI
jgi:hypothetical protein